MASMEPVLAQLLRSIESDNPSPPPLDQWHPALRGDIDIRIDAQGRWFHEGDPISRPQLVALFASILRREPEGYMLVTPVEKWRIQVEDHPFISAGVELRTEAHAPLWVLQDNVGRWHPLCREMPLLLDELNGQPVPYLALPRGLSVRLSRPDYYFLVEQAELTEHGVMIASAGERFLLGSLDS